MTRDWMKMRRAVRVDADGEPVDEHLPDAVFDALGRFVVRRQRVPVGREVKALVLLLQPEPVLQRTVIVADVHAPGGPHAGQDAVSEHGSKDDGFQRPVIEATAYTPRRSKGSIRCPARR